LLIAEGCTDYDYFGAGRTAMYGPDMTRFVNVFTGEVYLEGTDIQTVIQMNDRYFFVVFANHGQVYDFERGCFIDGLKVTELTLSMVPRAINDTVFEKLDFGHYRVYLGDGSVFGEIKNASFTEIGYIIETNDGFEVYDSNCTKLSTVDASFVSTEYATDVANTNCWRYFKGGEFKSYTVMDINGNTVLPGPYSGIQNCGDYVIVENDAAQKGLYLTDGTEILKTEYADIMYRISFGGFELTTANGEKQVYVPGCGIWDLGEFSISGKLIKDNGNKFMIITTGEVIQLESTYIYLNNAIVNSKMGVIDTYNGNVLLEPGYDFVATTEEHIYEYRDGMWHVYAYELVTE
jgi:hypothetical protein